MEGVVYHQSLGSTIAADIANYHIGPNHMSQDGLPGMAYWAFVGVDGLVGVVNDLGDRTWSQGDLNTPGDENSKYLAVCFGGDFAGPGHPGGEPTTEQIVVAARLWLDLRSIFSFQDHALYGHYDFGKAACPGSTLAEVIRALKENVVRFTTPMQRQRVLASLGYDPGPVDGVWGIRSRLALTRFQHAKGVRVDGIWDEQVESLVRACLP